MAMVEPWETLVHLESKAKSAVMEDECRNSHSIRGSLTAGISNSVFSAIHLTSCDGSAQTPELRTSSMMQTSGAALLLGKELQPRTYADSPEAPGSQDDGSGPEPSSSRHLDGANVLGLAGLGPRSVHSYNFVAHLEDSLGDLMGKQEETEVLGELKGGEAGTMREGNQDVKASSTREVPVDGECIVGEQNLEEVQSSASSKLKKLREAQEAVEMRILEERLQLLRSQRELAAARCERFTKMLENFLAKDGQQGGRTKGTRSIQKESRGSHKGVSPRVPRGRTATDDFNGADVFTASLLIPRASSVQHKHQRQSSLGAVDGSKRPSRHNVKGNHYRQRSNELFETCSGHSENKFRSAWRSPEFSGLWPKQNVPEWSIVHGGSLPGNNGQTSSPSTVKPSKSVP